MRFLCCLRCRRLRRVRRGYLTILEAVLVGTAALLVYSVQLTQSEGIRAALFGQQDRLRVEVLAQTVLADHAGIDFGGLGTLAYVGDQDLPNALRFGSVRGYLCPGHQAVDPDTGGCGSVRDNRGVAILGLAEGSHTLTSPASTSSVAARRAYFYLALADVPAGLCQRVAAAATPQLAGAYALPGADVAAAEAARVKTTFWRSSTDADHASLGNAYAAADEIVQQVGGDQVAPAALCQHIGRDEVSPLVVLSFTR